MLLTGRTCWEADACMSAAGEAGCCRGAVASAARQAGPALDRAASTTEPAGHSPLLPHPAHLSSAPEAKTPALWELHSTRMTASEWWWKENVGAAVLRRSHTRMLPSAAPAGTAQHSADDNRGFKPDTLVWSSFGAPARRSHTLASQTFLQAGWWLQHVGGGPSQSSAPLYLLPCTLTSALLCSALLCSAAAHL